MKTPHYQRVEKFMQLAGQDTPQELTELTPEQRVLRARLNWEETVKELILDGLGVDIWIGPYKLADLLAADKPEFSATRQYNAKEVIDGCMDTFVVTTGILVSMGLPDEPFQEEVDRNNLAKFGPGGHKDEETGKWIKPPGHQPPDIAGVLQRLTNAKALEQRDTSNNEAVRYDYAPEGIHFYHPVHQREMLLVEDEDHGYYGYLMMELVGVGETGSQWQVCRRATKQDVIRIKEAFDEINSAHTFSERNSWLKPTLAL